MTALTAMQHLRLRFREPIARARRAGAAELARNPRLHVGAFAILSLLLLSLWLAVLDDSRRAQVEASALAQRLAELRNLGAEIDWQQRSEGARRLRADLENRLWPAESDGLAQANFQNLIGKLAADNALETTDIRVEIVAAAGPMKLRQMTASLSGRFDALKLQGFLAEIARGRRLMTVDRLKIEAASPAAKFEISVTAYLRSGAPVAAGASLAGRS